MFTIFLKDISVPSDYVLSPAVCIKADSFEKYAIPGDCFEHFYFHFGCDTVFMIPAFMVQSIMRYGEYVYKAG